ncbi:CPBP family glutamic-type intramembrane protease [Paramicrobacterium sp. CJ85]|uniref:CPBP family glutamic-type intramembrane protease n=1 Tax=Paramicrobacterium sp. CJ85 TaxID=3445355 RepID=UPI003F646F12
MVARPASLPVRSTGATLAPALLLAASAVGLFGLGLRPWAYVGIVAALAASAFVSRTLLKDLTLIAVGLTCVSLVPVNTDIEWGHMLQMGAGLAAAVLIPYCISRWVYRDHTVRFPVATGVRWTTVEYVYLICVVVLGWVILPLYMIPTGVYQNWPAADDPSLIARLFLGTNGLGIWDELFFICTCFALLRRHLPMWQANLVQAIMFTSFLWELGFRAWGPLLIFPFALVQGWIFSRTKSLSYVVSVHLLFDFVLFLVLLHAHTRHWLPIFLY